MNNRRFTIVSLIVLAAVLITLSILGGDDRGSDDQNAAPTSAPADNGLRINP